MTKKQFNSFLFGGDYCPEQWPKEVWKEDMRLMREASVNMATIAVFNWAMSQPEEDVYTFEWLDEIMDMLHENGIMADLGTLTASPPVWMYKKYPQIRPMNDEGIYLNFGSRQTFCPSSEIYINFSRKLTDKLAAHFKEHPALAMWHINNELSHKVFQCFCDTCGAKFRQWLKEKYQTIESLNECWGTQFWGQHIFNWDEITPPRKTAQYVNPAVSIDYRRFMTMTYLNLYKGEADIVRKHTPDIPVTTNFLCEFKAMDYFKWGEHIDYIAVSSFPDPKSDTHPGYATLSHDLMRGLKNQKPFILLEQAPSQVTWRAYNTTKRPGVNRLWSYQGMAHGSDGFLFFQWRQSRQNAEKFHSAMVPHAGENTRIFKEIKQLGAELKNLTEIKDSKVKSEVCLIFDYDNWWAVENFPAPASELKYLLQTKKYSYSLQEMNITIDIQDQDGDGFDKYKMVVAPLMYMVKPDMAEKIRKFVKDGGIFVTSFFSSWVDHNDAVFPGGAPGPLKDVLGFSVEEYDVLSPGMSNSVQTIGDLKNAAADDYDVELWADVINLTTAQSLAVYKDDYYKDKTAVSVNKFGNGYAYCIATDLKNPFSRDFLTYICSKHGIAPSLEVPEGVEVVSRIADNGREFIFLLNHAYRDVEIKLPKGEFAELISGETLASVFVLKNTDVKILVKKQI
jgi:beta-galactosidase